MGTSVIWRRLKLDYHVAPRGEVYQSYTIESRIFVESEQSNSGSKEIFSPDFRLEISEDDFGVMGRTIIELFVEGTVFIFYRDVSTIIDSVVELSFDRYFS